MTPTILSGVNNRLQSAAIKPLVPGDSTNKFVMYLSTYVYSVALLSIILFNVSIISARLAGYFRDIRSGFALASCSEIFSLLVRISI